MQDNPMKDSELIKLLDRLREYRGDEIGFFVVVKGEKIAACSNNFEKIPSVLACVLMSNEYDLLRKVLSFIHSNFDEEQVNNFLDAVDDIFDEEYSEVDSTLTANELCKTCARYYEQSLGFGFCTHLRRAIDGEETNAANINNKKGCGRYRER